MNVSEPMPPKDVVAKYLWSMWRRGRRPDVHAFLRKAGELPPSQLLAVLRVDQQERWQSGERPMVDAYFQAHPQLLDCPEAFGLIRDEIDWRRKKSESVAVEEYCQRFPQFAKKLQEELAPDRPTELSGHLTYAL